MDSNSIILVIKAMGKEAIMELVKSRWIKFCLGLSVLLLAAPPFVRAIAEACK